MNCSKVLSMLSAYIDGEVRSDDALMVKEHLSACPSCAREHKMLMQTSNVLRAVTEVEPPAFLLEQIAAATVQKPAQRTSLRDILDSLVRVPQTVRYAAAAVALVAVLLSQHQVQQVIQNPETAQYAPSGDAPANSSYPMSGMTAEKPSTDTGSISIVELPKRVSGGAKIATRRHRRHVASLASMQKPTDFSSAHTSKKSSTKQEVLIDENDLASQNILAEPEESTSSETIVASVSDVVSIPAGEKENSTAASNVRTARLEQEVSQVEQLRAKIAQRNRNRKYDSYSEPIDVKKVSVELASVRF